MRHAGTQIIKTARLNLRRFELTDADAVFRNWTSDDRVARYMRWSAHKDVEETKTVIQSWCDRYKEDSTYHWGVCLEDGEIIGSIGVFITSEQDFKAELGYCIGRKWWGQGYMSEAVKAVIDYMFANTDIERIEAYHSIENPASGRVLAKAGMRPEGFLRHNYLSRDGFQDCNLYAIIRGETSSSTALADMIETPAPDFGKRLPYRGSEYLIVGVGGNKAFFANAFCVPVKFQSKQVKAACEQIYRDLARKDLTEMVREYAELLGLDPPKLRITGSGTVLGTCTKTLNFSWRLMMADDAVIDYVVVSTLAQKIAPSTSSQFWKVVGSVLPDFMEIHRNQLQFSKRLAAGEPMLLS